MTFALFLICFAAFMAVPMRPPNDNTMEETDVE